MIDDNDKLARRGLITASRMIDVMSVSKRDGKPLKAREDYMAEVALERLGGTPLTLPMTPPMQWGVDNEGFARVAYEAETGDLVIHSPFKLTPDLLFVGASPDGLVGEDGGVEIKCPYNSAVHFKTLMNGMPEDHIYQIQTGIWAFNRKWWDFVSYDPRMPERLRLYRQRVMRDDEMITKMKEQCLAFNQEVNQIVDRLTPKQEAA